MGASWKKELPRMKKNYNDVYRRQTANGSDLKNTFTALTGYE